MLDPVTALSVASSVAQLVDFASRIFTASVEAVKSTNGQIQQNVDIKIAAADLRLLAQHLQATSPPSPKRRSGNVTPSSRAPPAASTSASLFSSKLQLTQDELLWELAQRCSELSQDLADIINEIDAKTGGKCRTWGAVRQALLTVRKKEKIAELQRRLEPLKSELLLNLVSLMSDQQSDIHTWIADLVRTSQQAQINNVTELQRLRSDLTRAAEDHHKALADIRQVWEQKMQTTSAETPLTEGEKRKAALEADSRSEEVFDAVMKRLEVARDEGRIAAESQKILASLRFKEMPMRHNQIPDAYAGTFSWIFSSKPFRPWLERSGGVFWVDGKPGSGKSTLMKMLLDSPRTRGILETWAGSLKLVLAGFFFWHSGYPMQKSQEGLLQSLLLQILSQCPNEIPKACPNRWFARPEIDLDAWTKAEMLEILNALVHKPNTSTRFCFFIDGLDEYAGDHFDLVQTFAGFSRASTVKICVSSRPWNVFRKAYDEVPDRKLTLQDMTRSDLDKYIKGKLEEDPVSRR